MERIIALIIIAAMINVPAWAQLPSQTIENRVTGSEAFSSSNDVLPVGLISDMMVVGSWSDSALFSNAGAVFSFKWNGTDWVEQQKITPPDAAANMAFGWSLAVEEEIDTGEAWLVVGAPQTDSNKGAVHLYQRNGDNWDFKQTLTTTQNDFYGFDVDINVDIPFDQMEPQWDMVAGAPSYRFAGNGFNTGTVFISQLNNLGLWTSGAIPIGAETLPGNNPQYGRSVALDGDRVIAGGPSLQVDGNNGAGSIIIFSRGATWAGNTPVNNPDPVMNAINGAAFGADVDVVKQLTPPRNPTGNYVYIVGAPNPTTANDNGTVYILEPGDGSAFQALPRPQDIQGNDRYGTAVKFREDLESGDHRIIACSDGPGYGDSGGIYVYDQPALDQPWVAKYEFELAGIDQAPGNTGKICANIAAWNSFIAVAVPNAIIGNNAVYSNPILLLKDGFEDP